MKTAIYCKFNTGLEPSPNGEHMTDAKEASEKEGDKGSAYKPGSAGLLSLLMTSGAESFEDMRKSDRSEADRHQARDIL